MEVLLAGRIIPSEEWLETRQLPPEDPVVVVGVRPHLIQVVARRRGADDRLQRGEVASAKGVRRAPRVAQGKGDRHDRHVTLVQTMAVGRILVFDVPPEDACRGHEQMIVVLDEVFGVLQSDEPANTFKVQTRHHVVGVEVRPAAIQGRVAAFPPVVRQEIRCSKGHQFTVERDGRTHRQHIIMLRQVEILKGERGLPFLNFLHAVIVDLPDGMERKRLVHREFQIGVSGNAPVIVLPIPLKIPANGNGSIHQEVRMGVHVR